MLNLLQSNSIMDTAAKYYLKGVMNGKTTISTKAWKAGYAKLTLRGKHSISGILH